jgi:hypothetical protein
MIDWFLIDILICLNLKKENKIGGNINKHKKSNLTYHSYWDLPDVSLTIIKATTKTIITPTACLNLIS